LAKIETLIPDIENLLNTGLQEPNEEVISKYQELFGNLLRERLKPPEVRRTLRMSNIGKPDRQLWYEINQPELGEPLRAETRMKFLYGDVIELLLLFLAETAGHRVEGTQDEQDIEGVKGHRDGVIDGVLVDVKSASPFSFRKFSEHKLSDEGADSFGYLDQLGSYLYEAQNDPIVTDKGRAAFFVADKVGGHLTLDIWPKSDVDYSQVYRQKINMVSGPKPMRCFDDEPEGKSGNMKLGVNCSYCAFKRDCWPGLRIFKYYKGPVFLTNVRVEPKVQEIFWDQLDEEEEDAT
jgi:hypothetical protein